MDAFGQANQQSPRPSPPFPSSFNPLQPSFTASPPGGMSLGAPQPTMASPPFPTLNAQQTHHSPPPFPRPATAQSGGLVMGNGSGVIHVGNGTVPQNGQVEDSVSQNNLGIFPL